MPHPDSTDGEVENIRAVCWMFTTSSLADIKSLCESSTGVSVNRRGRSVYVDIPYQQDIVLDPGDWIIIDGDGVFTWCENGYFQSRYEVTSETEGAGDAAS